MDEECQEEDDEDEDCDELPVVYPLDMHDGVCPGHHILTAPSSDSADAGLGSSTACAAWSLVWL